MGEYLFVYGTLRRGHDNRYAQRLDGEARYKGEARVNGTLYAVKHYPGLVLGGPGEVTGELFELGDGDGLLAELDDYEGDEYKRVVCEVSLEGRVERAWVYEYMNSLKGKRVIESGDWKAR
jgi:gamma-glutamylcyclotransferase (GGCT)/AIG2-like uncharacterized protein YtfP